PVRHSIGFVVHNAGFQSRRRDAVYLPLLSEDLADFRRAALRFPLAGFSVTIPHKQGILRYLDKADGWVAAAGAANTVRIRRGRWEATNTDIEGIRAPIRQRLQLASRQRLPADFRAVVVGNGGAARAAVIALRSLGCRAIVIAGRNPSHAQRLAREMEAASAPLEVLRRERFSLLIHATPVGMWPHVEQCLLQPGQLNAGIVFDLVYNPPQTKLLRRARARGCRTISGLEMFLIQAARQFEFWTGEPAPLRRMRAVAAQALEQMRRGAPPGGEEPA
ncbi:MAG TPA: shikimate dehydrogenase, partial [Terriglobia bacterium]|nr:shikimate dehydrogenase [Terriglobia bacterium]